MPSSDKVQDDFSIVVQPIYLQDRTGSKAIDITQFIVQLHITEDIFSPFISCELVINDFAKLSSIFPLIGEEFLFVSFFKPGSVASEASTYQFLMYKQSLGGINENNETQMYVLHGVTIERAIDKSLTFSQSYHSSYSDMVSSIYNQYFGKVELPKSLLVEQTKGIEKFVVPNLTPFSAIQVIKRKSYSTKEPYTPFVFFQNKDEFVFQSLNTLFGNALSKPTARLKHCYSSKYLSGDSSNEGDLNPLSSRVMPGGRINDIISLTVLHKYNTVDKIDHNVFSGISKSFDLTTKGFRRLQYDFRDKKQAFFLGDKNDTNTSEFYQNLSLNGSSGPYIITDLGRYADGNTGEEYRPDAIMPMNAYFESLIQKRLFVNLYGDPSIKAGDAIFIEAIARDDSSFATLNNSYLISSVKQSLVYDSSFKLLTAVECLAGSYSESIK